MPVTITNPVLAEHAAEIRRLGKQTVENVIEIGRHLAEAKAEVKKLGGAFDYLGAGLRRCARGGKQVKARRQANSTCKL